MTDKALGPSPHDAESYRARELDWLFQRLLRSHDRLVVIAGAAGIGKTVLARLFGSRYTAAFPGGIEWFSDSLHAAPTDLTSPGRHGADGLVVFDGTFDGVITGEAAHALRRLIRDSDRQSVVITRFRARTLGFFTSEEIGLADPQVLTLGPLSQADVEDLLRRAGIPEGERTAFHSFGGHPLLLTLALRVRLSGASLNDLTALLHPIDADVPVDAIGKPMRPGSPSERALVMPVQAITEDLLRELRDDPRRIFSLTPERFEELIADMLRRLGYEVRRTPLTADGGLDVFAVEHTALGAFMYAVECKLWRPDRPVGVQLVRHLYGVVDDVKAAAGILVSTSGFTRGAKEFELRHQYRVSLREFVDLQQWFWAHKGGEGRVHY